MEVKDVLNKWRPPHIWNVDNSVVMHPKWKINVMPSDCYRFEKSNRVESYLEFLERDIAPNLMLNQMYWEKYLHHTLDYFKKHDEEKANENE